jgi:hypothetical protein
MSRISGVVTVTVDGQSFDLTGDVAAPLNKTTKESVTSLSGAVHYKETPIAPYLSCTFMVTEEFPVKKLQESDDMTLVAKFANGLTYQLSGAFVEGEMEFSSDGGSVEVRFTGQDGDWL